MAILIFTNVLSREIEIIIFLLLISLKSTRLCPLNAKIKCHFVVKCISFVPDCKVVIKYLHYTKFPPGDYSVITNGENSLYRTCINNYNMATVQ